MKVAITGASGYIGSYISHALGQQGYEVYSLGRTAQAQLIPFQLGAVNDYAPLRQMDVLIHCAYDFSLTDKTAIEAINVAGSIDLLKSAHAYGVKKIIYLSSTSAFAGALSHYGQAKYAVECFAKMQNITIVRPGLVFNEHPRGIVGSLNNLVKKLPLIPIIGLGDQAFFPCHIDDLVNMLLAIIDKDIPVELPIIAANEIPITFKEIILTLAAWHHKKVMLLPIPYSCLYLALYSAELLKLNIGLRSDSLKYMKHYEREPDFAATRLFNSPFRPFTVKTLESTSNITITQ